MFEVRKIVVSVDKTFHDGGPAADLPLIRGGACAIVRNPFAGDYVQDIAHGMDALTPLGEEMAGELIRAMGCPTEAVEAYGKGAIVGASGELEHGALWHVPGGYAMRRLLGETKAIVPSTKKVGRMGDAIDIPISHINAAYVRSHFSTMTLQVPDAPKDDEIVFCLAMATGGRIHDRMGGLSTNDVKGEDGLR